MDNHIPKQMKTMIITFLFSKVIIGKILMNLVLMFLEKTHYFLILEASVYLHHWSIQPYYTLIFLTV